MGVEPVGAAVKVQVNVTGLAFDTVASLDVMTAETDRIFAIIVQSYYQFERPVFI